MNPLNNQTSSKTTGSPLGGRPDEYFQDEPTYRSVAMMPPQTSLMRQEVVRKEPMFVMEAPKTALRPASSSSWITSQPTPITQENVLTIAKTHTFVPLTFESSPAAVGGRIERLLKHHSITVDYSNTSHHQASCQFFGIHDCEHVVFDINVFSSKKLPGCIVEVSKYEGDSISFNLVATAILDAASNPYFSTECNCSSAVIARKMQLIRTAPSPFSICGNLDIISSMLNSDLYDSLSAGLIALVSATATNSVGLAAAQAVASKISWDGAASSITKSLAIILSANFTVPLKEETDQLKSIRRLALVAVRNCLRLAPHTVLADDLIKICVNDLKAANSSPQEAYLAAQILTSLITSCSAIGENAVKHGATEALRRARDVGMNKHAKLAEAANEGLQEIESL